MNDNWPEHPHFVYPGWRLWNDRETGEFFIESEHENLSICVGTIYGDDERKALFTFLNRFGDYVERSCQRC